MKCKSSICLIYILVSLICIQEIITTNLKSNLKSDNKLKNQITNKNTSTNKQDYYEQYSQQFSSLPQIPNDPCPCASTFPSCCTPEFDSVNYFLL